MLYGCTAPHAYMDGAPVRVAPVEPITTYTPAGAGLPEYWGQPDRPTLEPNPKPTRELPQTEKTRREPGIWASDKRKIGGPLKILDVVLPVPTFEDEQEAGDVDVCAWAIGDLLRPNGPLAAYLLALRPDQRFCGVLRAWSFCMRVHFGDDARWEASEKIRAAVQDPLDERCRHVDTVRFMMHFDDAMRKWVNDRGAVQ